MTGTCVWMPMNELTYKMCCDTTATMRFIFSVAFNLEHFICYLLSIFLLSFFLHITFLTFYQNPLKDFSEKLQEYPQYYQTKSTWCRDQKHNHPSQLTSLELSLFRSGRTFRLFSSAILFDFIFRKSRRFRISVKEMKMFSSQWNRLVQLGGSRAV